MLSARLGLYWKKSSTLPGVAMFALHLQYQQHVSEVNIHRNQEKWNQHRLQILQRKHTNDVYSPATLAGEPMKWRGMAHEQAAILVNVIIGGRERELYMLRPAN